jgi:DNA-binding FadR family transcriptional regulator
MIARDLRNRILNGTIADGEMLPRQDELLEAFGVSMPSLRGALQILETEGLITVLRGSVGGAIVHIVTHGMHHRAQLLYMLRLLGVQNLIEGDALSWESQLRSAPN